MSKILMTDLGHDPDDAIALSYLIEHAWIPSHIILSPGFPLQVEIAAGICEAYGVQPKFGFFTSKHLSDNGNYNPGKHKVFTGKPQKTTCLLDDSLTIVGHEALIIGPAKNIGGKLKCSRMVFQGGYSPNSIHPLEKFKNINAVQSFNPSGAKDDFNMLLTSKEIDVKMYVGKNVCHGYTKSDLKQSWEPSEKKVKDFWDTLKDTKAMHDVLAAMVVSNIRHNFEWERAKPVWFKNKMSTCPTQDSIFTLIGVDK